MSNIIKALPLLFDRLTASFGKPGEQGDVREIYDACVLLNEVLIEAIKHEEIVRFTLIPETGRELRALIADTLGRNLERLEELPKKLDEIVAMSGTDHDGTKDSPLIVTWTVPFELPENFESQYEIAFERYMTRLLGEI